MTLATVADILFAISCATGVPVAEIVGEGRRRLDATLARDGAIWLLRRGRGMTVRETAGALGVSYFSIAPAWARLKDEPAARGGRRIALAAAIDLAQRGLDAWPDPPSVERVREVVAAFAQEAPAALCATRAGRPWSVGRKAFALALLDARRMAPYAVAATMGVQRSSLSELLTRLAAQPNGGDAQAQRVARAAVRALRAAALNEARSVA